MIIKDYDFCGTLFALPLGEFDFFWHFDGNSKK